ncbi:phosphate ABC transporter permease PstA [Glacieibacterium megasporae]|uniref:phosphate ABC transporter permease PstA n=1 Tax=Glacieibacterium megasporae TaxID=2835787 RepID=UPI001C1E4A45|nr:phosphate ABC transporter permease PstA [Polymorphobacter megasporae]UAJ09990.1 phosphate ABC transporter permease PstA [Polymorphobacter megasporae]
MSARTSVRKATNVVIASLATGAALLSLAILASILWTLIARGAPALRFSTLTTSMAPTGENGGLANAIIGSLIQVGIGMLIATPIGVLAGTYLSEYAKGSKLGDVTRFVSDILLSAPSILIGLFVYVLLVATTKTYSGFAGGVALAVIAIPIIIRTTEDMLSLVPVALREAAAALGAPKWKVVTQIAWRAAGSGMLTGILLALARSAGETAPLLFTSLGNLNWSTSLGKPMASLPVAIYQFASSPYEDLVQLAWAGALLITLGVLAINIIAQLTVGRRR